MNQNQRIWKTLVLVLASADLWGPIYVGAAPSPQRKIRCEICIQEGCADVTKIWSSDKGGDRMIWFRDRAHSGEIPECGIFSFPPGTWYHVCQKNSSIIMVTNDSATSVTYGFEAPGHPLKSKRKAGEECPKLKVKLDPTDSPPSKSIDLKMNIELVSICLLGLSAGSALGLV